MSYVYLIIAIASEITATMTLKASESFTRFWPSVVVILAVCCSLYCFSQCVRTLNVAIVYSMWSGVGVSAVTVLGWLIYDQRLDTPSLLGIGLIVAGIVVMSLFSTTVEVAG